MSDILLVCQANQCRSPMAEALLRRHLARAGVAAGVSSAGLADGGQPATFGAVRALRRRSLDLRDHQSRQVTPAMMGDASLVIGLERRHVRDIVVMAPDTWPRTFTLKELVRRGALAGPRRGGESAEAWIERVHADRRREELIGADERDDVEDPMGASAADYERTADELDALVVRLVDLLVGEPAPHESGAVTNA